MDWIATTDDVDYKRGPLRTGDNLTAAVRRALFESDIHQAETAMIRLVDAGGHVVTFAIEV